MAAPKRKKAGDTVGVPTADIAPPAPALAPKLVLRVCIYYNGENSQSHIHTYDGDCLVSITETGILSIVTANNKLIAAYAPNGWSNLQYVAP